MPSLATWVGTQCLGILGGTALGVIRCRVLLQRQPGQGVEQAWGKSGSTLGWLLIPVALVMLNHQFSDRLAWQWALPFWLQIYYEQINWALINGVLGYLLGGSVGGYFFQHHPRRWWMLGATLLLALPLEGGVLYQFRPQPPRMAAPRFSGDGLLIQSSTATCAPTAAANILRSYGVEVGEREMVARFGTQIDGTLPGQIALGMESFGFAVTKRSLTRHDIKKVQAPAILFFMQDTHAVAFMGMKGDRALLWDPMMGKQQLTPGKMSLYWTGHVLEFTLVKTNQLKRPRKL